MTLFVEKRNPLFLLESIVAVFVSDNHKQKINEFVLEHMYLVHQEVCRITKRGCIHHEYDDLFQLGMLGLIESAQRFDGRHHRAFSTYARIRIQGSIIDAMRKNDWVPRSVRKRAQLLHDTVAYLSEKQDAPPSSEAIARHLNIPQDKLDDFYRLALITPVSNIDEESIQIATHLPNAQDRLIEKETIRLLYEGMAILNDQEQDILHRYYFENWNLREIAAQYHVSESRICQIHGQIKHKLHRFLRSKIAH